MPAAKSKRPADVSEERGLGATPSSRSEWLTRSAVGSADGSWELLADPDTEFGAGYHYFLDHLTLIDGSLVMLGRLHTEGDLDQCSFDSWLSNDGRSWERVRVPVTVDGRITQVAATGGAGLAVLSTTESAGVDEPKPFAVSTSPDGRTWTTVELSSAGQARGVVVTDDGFVVYGLDGTIEDGPVPTRWVSADGITRESHESDLPADLIIDTYLRDVIVPVTEIGDGYVAMIGTTLYASGLDWPAAGG